MARWNSNPKQTVKVQTLARSLEGRLAKIEQELAEVEANERLSNCTCQKKPVLLTAGRVAEFRVEMNRLCPVHGFRELNIMHVTIGNRDASSPEEAEVEEALQEYDRRLEESKQQPAEDD